jgi:large subunit ribosomal protein L25
MLSLTVEKKNNESKNKSLVKAGRIPSIYYGPKQASTPISIDLKSFSKVWKVAGESQVIILKDGNEEHEALIHEVDVHPVNGVPRHVDFYVIEKGKKVSVKIPLIFSGISPAVKDNFGNSRNRAKYSLAGQKCLVPAVFLGLFEIFS